ncbi:MAG: hypothetical protein AAF467_18100 [Actinomycetota bacterium]
MPWTRVLAVALAFFMFAAACGDDDGDGSSPDASTPAEGATETQNDDQAETDEQSEADADLDQEQDETAVASSGGDADAFCSLWDENQALDQQYDFFNPAEAEQFFTTSNDLLGQAVGVAPAEISSDLQLVQTSFEELLPVFEAAGWDVFALLEEDEALLENPEADAASDRVQTWATANCPEAEPAADVDPEDAMEDATDAFASMLASESGRSLLAEQIAADGTLTAEESTCVVDGLTPEMLAVFVSGEAFLSDAAATSNPEVASLLELLETCGVDLEALI